MISLLSVIIILIGSLEGVLSVEREIGKWKYHSTNYQGEIFVPNKVSVKIYCITFSCY